MATIKPFCGLRYNSAKISSMDKVICPPYDIISPEEQSQYYSQNRYNIVRLELPQGNNNSRYSIAERIYHQWRKNKVLVIDKTPAFYLYVHDFTTADGKIHSRYGFFCALKLEPWGKNVRPHEKTFPHHKSDRLEMLRRLKSNISPIFAIFSDPKKQVYDLLKKSNDSSPIIDVNDQFGIRHRLWQIQDILKIKEIQNRLANQTVYIADGHHRYETALNYYRENKKNVKKYPGIQYVLTYLCPMEDPGLIVLPTHRVVTLNHDFDFDNWLTKKTKYFEFIKHQKLCKMLSIPRLFGLIYRNELFGIKIKPNVQRIMKKLLPKNSATYRQLDVTILHTLLLRDLDIKQINYFKSIDESIKSVKDNNHQMVIILNATKVGQIESVALSGETMPEKSTYFYPKLATGLVMYSLENSL